MNSIVAALSALLLIAAAGSAAAQDKYVGYHYPEITSSEDFDRVIKTTPPAGKDVRVNFVTAITKAQLEAPESPRFVFFTKGGASDILIIIALDDEVFKSLYRARAVMAQMTSNIRGTEFFRNQRLHIAGTFFDMLQILEFNSMVISDGDTWAHQVNFKR